MSAGGAVFQSFPLARTEDDLYPSAVVTLALLFALKGVRNRAFYRWLTRDYRCLFPHLPERIRLFRLFNSHRRWMEQFMAAPSLLGWVDTYGIALLHPWREGCSVQQIGRKGLLNKRWIVGGKLCFVLNHLGLIVDWAVDTANVYDGAAFQDIVERHAENMVLFADGVGSCLRGNCTGVLHQGHNKTAAQGFPAPHLDASSRGLCEQALISRRSMVAAASAGGSSHYHSHSPSPHATTVPTRGRGAKTQAPPHCTRRCR